MHHVFAQNVNEAFYIGLGIFANAAPDAVRMTCPRGQRRIELKAPFITTYRMPTERVLFHPVRDANPFFHLMESLWIIAGRDDVAWLKQWLPSIADYSDDGDTFHGAYGYRMQSYQQLPRVINRLQAEPDSTRCVLALYQPHDVKYVGKDMPCNTTIYLLLRDGALDITVCNRSNDMIWGTYGANAVQFSMLQEYIAICLGVKVGTYIQFSNNTHIYPDNEATKRVMEAYRDSGWETANYDKDGIHPYALMQDPDQWDTDLDHFMTNTSKTMFTLPEGYKEPFFRKVAAPMANAHLAYRNNRLDEALDHAGECAATDWRKAALAWLRRRQLKRQGQ